jgi:hypothetical protein
MVYLLPFITSNRVDIVTYLGACVMQVNLKFYSGSKIVPMFTYFSKISSVMNFLFYSFSLSHHVVI